MTAPAACPAGTTSTGGPLLFYLQSSSPDGIARDAAGASDINNDEVALFVQDRWQAGHGLTLDYGLRWDAQTMPDTVDPTTTAFAPFLSDPRFPSDGTIPSQWKQFQPRVGFAWDVNQDGKSVVRGSAGVYYARQNMLSQVGSVTTNGIQQKSDFRSTAFGGGPVWPNLLPPSAVAARDVPALHRAFASSIAITRIRASTASTPATSGRWRRTRRPTSTSPSPRAST